MAGHLIVAGRDVDPPVGGAEISLSTLVDGVMEAGPLLSNAPQYIPLKEASLDGIESHDEWKVTVLQSSDRGVPERWVGEADATTHPDRLFTTLPIEGLLSGAAWRLRSKKKGQSQKHLLRMHLKRRNRFFQRWLESQLPELIDKSDGPVIGLTQLDWSAGAAAAFRSFGIPYMLFVRDDLQYRHPNLYRESIEGAAVVCGAGEGLLAQVKEWFNPKKTAPVHLPVDFNARFESLENVKRMADNGKTERKQSGESDNPTIGAVVITPEKGFATYQRLLPHLAEVWPEARVNLYGGGAYADSLDGLGNCRSLGHAPIGEIFSKCDVQLSLFTTTGSWGRVIAEAGVFGVPTVSVDVGAQREAVGEGGIVLSKDPTIEEITSALKEVYEKREEFGNKARKHVGIVDHRRSVAEFREVLHSLID